MCVEMQQESSNEKILKVAENPNEFIIKNCAQKKEGGK